MPAKAHRFLLTENQAYRLKLSVIAVFALLNFLFGYIFQLSRGVICITELSVLVVSSAIFWVAMIKPIQRISNTILGVKSSDFSKVGILALLGFLVLASNLVFSQLMVHVIVYRIFETFSPSSHLIVAAMTNNLGGNLFCISLLMVISIYYQKNQSIAQILNEQRAKKKTTNHFLMLNHGASMIKVDYKDISQIESSQNCIVIYAQDKKYVKYQSMKSFLDECPSTSFKRIHRSHAVNTDYVSRIKTNDNGDGQVFLKNGHILRLSRTFRKDLLDATA